MGYHVVDPDGVTPAPDRPWEQRSISDAAGLSQLGCHLYRADSGEQVPLSNHVHERQEEVFYVLEGTLSVETSEGTLEADDGEAFVAEPGSPHRAYNDAGADDRVELLAVGAPAVDDVSEYEP